MEENEATSLDQLCAAIEENDLIKAESLLTSVENINEMGFHGRSPVVCAVRNGLLSALQLLESKKIDFAFTDSSGNTLLHMAAKGGYSDIASYLISHKAPLEQLNDSGSTPLALAVLREDFKTCQLLSQAGANPLLSLSGGSPLELALRGTNFSILKMLLKNVPKENPDLQKQLPLLCGMATSEGSLALLDFLQEHFSLDFDFIVTPAEEFKYFVNRLYRNGENQEYLARFLQVTSPHAYEIPLLAWAVAFEQESIVEYLIQQKVAVDRPIPPNGATALMWAAVAGHATIVQTLINAGAIATTKDHQGQSALDLVETYGYFFSHRLILKSLRQKSAKG